MERLFFSEYRLALHSYTKYEPFSVDKGSKNTQQYDVKSICNELPLLSFLLPLLVLFIIHTTAYAEETTPPEGQVSTKEQNQDTKQEDSFSTLLGKYVRDRWAWGVVDEIHGIGERTEEIHAYRVGNLFAVRTPFGAFLWGYERTEGKAALFPRRNNVFGGSLNKQPFKQGNQDKRQYGYALDTKKFRRWLEDSSGDELLQKLPADAKGYFIFTDSSASVGQKPFSGFASEKFEAIQSSLSVHMNRGRWFGLGFDFGFTRYNPTTLGNFGNATATGVFRFDQREIIDRDVWLGRITVPVLENFHISGLYEEDHDVHGWTYPFITSVAGIPVSFIPTRKVRSTQRKFGPEVKYFFDEDLHKAASFGFYSYVGESAGRLAEFGLQRAFRIDSAGEFGALTLHNSFGVMLGYQEYEKNLPPDAIKSDYDKWGTSLEVGYLDSHDVSSPFSGAIFRTTPPLGPTIAVRQFDEELKQVFAKGDFYWRFHPKDEPDHPLAGKLRADFSFWNIEKEGKQTQDFPLLGISDDIPNFRDDRRIIQLGASYELDKPRHHFLGLYSIGADFSWDIETSDKVAGMTLGFFY